MKISNLRKFFSDDKVYLSVDVECKFSSAKQLWFSSDKAYADWIADDVYDSFMIAAVYACMYYHEDIVVEGYVSKFLYRNLIDYIIPVIRALRKGFKEVSITVKGYKDAIKSKDNIIGTGFSGGVDSFNTIISKYIEEVDPEYRINTLFFFNVGQYKGSDNEASVEKAMEFYGNSKQLADELNLPYIFLDTNLFDFYLPAWEYDAGPMCRISSILIFQRALRKYYISGSNHYLQQNSSIDKQLDDVTDEFIYYMLSPKGTELILDGNQYFRSEKIENMVDYDFVQRHLNVCVNNAIDVRVDKNCSRCHKCLRTLIVLESLGKLNEFRGVFNLDVYARNAFRGKCWISLNNGHGAFATENYKFAVSHGIKMPSKLRAWLYLLPGRALPKLKRLINGGK